MKNILLRDKADPERPYEKCLIYGPAALTDVQLLAVVLRSGTSGRPVIEVAEEVLRRAPGSNGLLGLCSLSIPELTEISGIGEVKAIQLTCIAELSRRIAAAKRRERISLDSPASIADYFMETLRHEERESLYCVMLDTRSRLLGQERISMGTQDQAVFSVRDIFLAALRHRATSLVMVHNHPSGDPTPSAADREATDRVGEGGRILGIRLLDHIIIGNNSYFSFAEADLILHPEE